LYEGLEPESGPSTRAKPGCGPDRVMLIDGESGETLRPASNEEMQASAEAGGKDGGAGIILIDANDNLVNPSQETASWVAQPVRRVFARS
jgi:hypothetical protein